ncbi:hypothetical protein BH11PLA1_BH11PLA1_01990 [soil metagenome]
MNLGKIWRVVKDAVSGFSADGAAEHAAALSFYTIISLAPLLLLTVGIVGLVAADIDARGALTEQFAGMAGEESRGLVESMLKAPAKEERGLMATVSGVVVLIVGATGTFAQLKSALNQVWEVESAPGVKRAWYMSAVGLVWDRLLSFGMVLVIAFLLLGSLVVSAGLTGFIHWSEGWLPAAGLFAVMFKFLPDATIGWREVLLGAVITSVLFNVGKYGIGAYLGKSAVASPFGAAGSVVVVLLWVYYSSMIFLLGAEITQATAAARGHALVAKKGYRLKGRDGEEDAAAERGHHGEGMGRRVEGAVERRESGVIADSVRGWGVCARRWGDLGRAERAGAGGNLQMGGGARIWI